MPRLCMAGDSISGVKDAETHQMSSSEKLVVGDSFPMF